MVSADPARTGHMRTVDASQLGTTSVSVVGENFGATYPSGPGSDATVRPSFVSHTLTVPSWPPPARSVPSSPALTTRSLLGPNRTSYTRERWPRSTATGAPPATLQTLVEPSRPPAANRLPSALKATAVRRPCPLTDLTCAPVRVFHSLIRPSSPTLTIRLPSGVNATSAAGVPPLSSTRPVAPSALFHSRTLPSSPALTTRLPSVLRSTPSTGPSWPLSRSVRAVWSVESTRTVPSPRAAATHEPSPLKATSSTLWPSTCSTSRGAESESSVIA